MPKNTAPGDAIVRVTHTTICGTDLHILKGDVATAKPGRILGHEGVGVVESVGAAVTAFKKGDTVLISCVSACGTCSFCRKQMYSHCTTGGWILGNGIDGTQAEYVRTPHADMSLYHVPKGADLEALVMLSDILPTGFECGVLNGKVAPGATVAIVGAGPVGLAAPLTAQFYSPGAIIMIDLDDNRLETAKRFGATTCERGASGKDILKTETSMADPVSPEPAPAKVPALRQPCPSTSPKGPTALRPVDDPGPFTGERQPQPENAASGRYGSGELWTVCPWPKRPSHGPDQEGAVAKSRGDFQDYWGTARFAGVK